jgi:hypothetical protein
VLRGGAGFFVPFGHQMYRRGGSRASFVANFAFGYYFTPHGLTPFGDLVWYLSTNLVQSIDHHNTRSTNTVSSPRVPNPPGAELVFPRRRRGARGARQAV